MKGQAEISELLVIVLFTAVMIAVILLVPTIFSDFNRLLSVASAEVIARDLAGLVTVIKASPKDIVVTYESPNEQVHYTAVSSDRQVFVELFDNNGVKLSEATAESGVKHFITWDETRTFIGGRFRPTPPRGGIYPAVPVPPLTSPPDPAPIPPPAPVLTPPAPLPPVPVPPIPPTQLGKSKLGFQTAFNTHTEMDFIKKTKPAVVKLIGSIENAAEIKQKSPNTFVVGRIYESQPTVAELLSRVPETDAENWFNRNKDAIEKNKDNIDCWEGYNELPPGETKDQMVWYSRFEIKRMQLLESIGERACIGNFGVTHPYPGYEYGWPPLNNWEYFKGALDYAKNNGHILGLHEYSHPTLQQYFDGYASYTSLRYRKIYDKYHLRPLGLIITEAGIANIAEGECEGKDVGLCGWKDAKLKPRPLTPDEYFNQLKWYDSELKKDDYVIGATLFGYGLSSPWESFEIHPELTDINGNFAKYIEGTIG